jgi:uncharacterized protein YdiU (UPF0061 family)
MTFSVPAPNAAPDFRFANTYARLPEHFYSRVHPTPVARPRLIKLNVDLARFLGVDPDRLAQPEGVEILAGNRIAAGSEPLAMAYAGHQFGHFVPQLGDGRANLLGEVIARDGKRYDLQLKGSGPTPFSRRGDGRAALGPVLREYLVSEAMAALGVPTTRALAAVGTGEPVYREGALPGAIFTRVAASHLRVGTFQYFMGKADVEGVRTLANYAISRHYPEAAESPAPMRALLAGVVGRHAALVAQWMAFGFIHGVMNTDNTSISGETIDYGPCAFMEAFNPRQFYSSIDHQGRYAYANQPHAAHWNLTRLAETLLPLLEEEAGGKQAGLDAAYAALEGFGTRFEAEHLGWMRRKLGLLTAQEGDAALAQDLLERMAANAADFTLTFRLLADAAAGTGSQAVRALFREPAAFDAWSAKWLDRLGTEPADPRQRADSMRLVNPRFIPRNHLVEAAIDAAVEHQNLAPFEDLLAVVLRPYDDQPGRIRYAQPARPEECVRATFCGT